MIDTHKLSFTIWQPFKKKAEARQLGFCKRGDPDRCHVERLFIQALNFPPASTIEYACSARITKDKWKSSKALSQASRAPRSTIRRPPSPGFQTMLARRPKSTRACACLPWTPAAHAVLKRRRSYLIAKNIAFVKSRPRTGLLLLHACRKGEQRPHVANHSHTFRATPTFSNDSRLNGPHESSRTQPCTSEHTLGLEYEPGREYFNLYKFSPL